MPAGNPLTIAPSTLDDRMVFVKRPGLNCYETMKGTPYIPMVLLEETLIMEEISKSPHPNIITYHGCNVRRGRIASIVLEKLDQTLTQYIATRTMPRLDSVSFLQQLNDALAYIHSLGLAHNDINPDNIMIKKGSPTLIDFGSCQPFGKSLRSLGTEGWYKEDFRTSAQEHDTYSMEKLQEWFAKQE